MKLLNEKYNSLKPKAEYISDKAVLAQAWKKTHNYIRQHNWYADPLALDISALGLEKNIENWSAIISDKSYNQSKNYPIELVPAPKSEKWTITTNWQPSTKDRDTNPPLRPLAHITVRDQTFATSLMMCVADAVETAQGDCSNTNFFDAQRKHVFSYGNRLLCDWNDKEAWFRWGNGEIYRKFFTDYQNFLKRPLYIGREISNSQSDNDHVFVVKLDLSKFYDKIDRSTLLKKLAKLCEEYYETNDSEFWRISKSICSWQWDDSSINSAKKIGLNISNNGLPQGLVSAGFFANIYLLDFDEKLGSYINKTIPKAPQITLHDYCRYVDDLRLVVSVDGELPGSVANQISNWINELLAKHADVELSINPQKTKVTSLSDLDNAGNLSSKVRNIQDELSGPMDRDSLEGVTGALESLLDLKTDFDTQPDDENYSNPLIKLIQIDTDIRDDTLKRFAANRLEQVISKKRKLSFEQSDIKDNESELLSRKLIKAWMQDPSLAIVLRKAFEIYPSIEIGEPVLSEVYKLSIPKTDDRVTSAIMNYLLADIFRCCIDLNSTSDSRDYPESTNLDEFLDLGAQYASKILNEDRPKFLKRQASLLLAVLNRPTLMFDSAEELIQDSLHKILIGRPPRDTYQVYPLYEVAAQITDKPNLIASYLINHISSLDDERRKSILEDFAKRDSDGFWLSIWKILSKDKYKSDKELFSWSAPTSSINLQNGKQKLSRIIRSDRNGFEHEQGLIKLALGLINFIENHRTFNPDEYLLSPNELSISCKTSIANWEEIWKPEFAEIVVTSVGSAKDPRFKIPEWITKSDESCKIYWIGAILRATAIGTSDFTDNRWRSNPKFKSYKGLKTGWYKRRMGMMYSPEALVGEYGTLSNWICELLMKCLQWPGFQSSFLSIKEISEISDFYSFKKVLHARLTYLNLHYCESSKMPTAITQIRRKELNNNRGFRIVTVQQMLPKTKDFSLADLTLDSPKLRAISRDHLSKICNLAYKTICAKLSADSDINTSGADLIVFPEVAIHHEDQDLIKRLADKTNSIVFAGMVFMDYKGKIVNNGRWFIPDYQTQGRRWVIRDQGKANMTFIEKKLGISPHRPCQHLIEVHGHPDGPFKITGAICYDATDLKLASDLRGKSDLFVVCAHNKDVNTFDTMVSALNYHMYQHVVVVNKGEFGGSTIQAPYKESYERLISHAHGGDQISINIADLDLAAFRRTVKEYKKVKYKPAGLK